MKAKTFENLIRKIVREEIDYALRREIKSLKEDLREEVYRNQQIETIKESQPSTTVPENVKTSLREKIMGKQAFKPQSFASNPALNDLLNETAMGDTNTETAQSPGVPVESMPAPVQNVVNRDYRELMKAIDKKKNR
jgi:hypothetical protein